MMAEKPDRLADDHLEIVASARPVAEKSQYQQAQLKSTFDTLSLWKCAWVFRCTVLVAGLAGFTAVTDGEYLRLIELPFLMDVGRISIPTFGSHSGQYWIQGAIFTRI